jgi:hypothetical protein
MGQGARCRRRRRRFALLLRLLPSLSISFFFPSSLARDTHTHTHTTNLTTNPTLTRAHPTTRFSHRFPSPPNTPLGEQRRAREKREPSRPPRAPKNHLPSARSLSEMRRNAWRTARASADARARPVAPRRGRGRAAVVRAIIEQDPSSAAKKNTKASGSGGAAMNALEVRQRGGRAHSGRTSERRPVVWDGRARAAEALGPARAAEGARSTRAALCGRAAADGARARADAPGGGRAASPLSLSSTHNLDPHPTHDTHHTAQKGARRRPGRRRGST